ncbi:nucleotide-binding alpha-beta plait domain-containing protein [Tanacetum coccineum]
MGRYTTKEDDVDRISTSVYVTNFPDNVSAKELFLACKQYGPLWWILTSCQENHGRKMVSREDLKSLTEVKLKMNGIKDEHSDGEIVHESLFEDGELENNHVDEIEKKVDQNDEFSEAGDVDKLKGSANGSISAGHFKVSEIPRTGGSMVGLLEDVIKVGQVMGFKRTES